mgnify:CR=1 FL=1|jgi:hypothetical protein|nr:hypothetical protein [uncultured Dongia sp.]
MLTRLFLRSRAKAIAPSLEVVLSDCDSHLLQDMGLLRDPANNLMRAPAEFYAYDVTKFANDFGGPKAA